MLVLSRKKDERIKIGENVWLMVIEIRGDKVRLGIEAPADVPVHREEIAAALARENRRFRIKSENLNSQTEAAAHG